MAKGLTTQHKEPSDNKASNLTRASLCGTLRQLSAVTASLLLGSIAAIDRHVNKTDGRPPREEQQAKFEETNEA